MKPIAKVNVEKIDAAAKDILEYSMRRGRDRYMQELMAKATLGNQLLSKPPIRKI